MTTELAPTESQPRKRGRPHGSKSLAKGAARPHPHHRGREEGKAIAAKGILSILSPFTMPQQRAILKFVLETLKIENKRWSNDLAREKKISGRKEGDD